MIWHRLESPSLKYKQVTNSVGIRKAVLRANQIEFSDVLAAKAKPRD